MENIKYTSDGKKVSIVGKLNSQETIVQEIFVVGGNEVPSGENFVVKSLHDAPAISWKEKNAKEIEERYQKTKAQYDSELDRLNRSYKERKNELTEKLKYLRKFIDNAAVESFDTMTMFLKGEIKYMVKNSYSLELIPFDKFLCDYYKDQLKLITLFGKDDGTLQWGLNKYSDGSGSNDLFEPFTNKEDAVSRLQELIDAKERYWENDFKIAKEHGIKLDPKKVNDYKEKQLLELQGYKERKLKEVEDWDNRIKEINSL